MSNMYHIGKGGVSALNWRKGVAASSTRKLGKNDAHNRTFKFPLMVSEQSAVELQRLIPDVRNLYDTVSGVHKGSLTAFLFSLHLSGFRLFSKADERRVFETIEPERQREFKKIATECFGACPDNFSLPNVINLFNSKPRKDNAVWDKDNLVDYICRQKLRITAAEKYEVIRAVMHGLVCEIHGKYKDWDDVVAHPEDALLFVFSKLREAGGRFSDINYKSKDDKDMRVFSFDRSMDFYEMNDDNVDYWAHACVCMIAQSISRDGGDATEKKNIQARFTTQSNNGLSWLFGNGIKRIKENTVDDLCDMLQIPVSEKMRVVQLKEYADVLPDCDQLWGKSFSCFRSSVGGKLDGWISNYMSRLTDLKKLTQLKENNIELHSCLLDKENKHWFSGNQWGAEELKSQLKCLPEYIDSAGKAVNALSGHQPIINIEEHVARIHKISEFINTINGEISTINNRLDLMGENDVIAKPKAASMKIAKIKTVENLNRISGGADVVEDIISSLQHDMRLLVDARRNNYKDIVYKFPDCENNEKVLDAIVKAEREKLEEKNSDVDRAEEYAQRLVMHRYVSIAHRASEYTKSRIMEDIGAAFPAKDYKGRKNKDCNRLFHNRKGALYVSPFGRRRHEPLGLTNEALQADWINKVDKLYEDLKSKLEGGGAPELFRDMLLVENLAFSVRLGCLPNNALVPAKLVVCAMDIHDKRLIYIPTALRMQMENREEGKITSNDVQRVFNCYSSAINGLLFQLSRKSFISRLAIQRLDTSKLMYVPKNNCTWVVPKQYLSCNGAIATALKSDWVVWENKERCVIDVAKTFNNLSAKNLMPAKGDVQSSEAVAAYLAQAPHNWFLPLEINGLGDAVAGLLTDTGGEGKFMFRKSASALAIRGPSSRINFLDRLLWIKLREPALKIGSPNIIIDIPYSQSISLKGGTINIEVKAEVPKVDVAILMVDKDLDKNEINIFDRIVSIDLGEYGIGYAVFDLYQWLNCDGQPQPIKDHNTQRQISGTLAIPSIRGLIHAVKTHRGYRQPNQKVNSNFSNLLQQRRNSVIGEVCFKIDRLCQMYGAFPVLESTVGNFESGGKQLSLVYQSILSRYLHGDNKHQNSRRAHNWYLADYWLHPWLMKAKYNKKTSAWDTSTSEGLYKLYPGASVAPAGTSQKCHRCGRNPLDDLRASVADDCKIEVGYGGLLRLKQGAVRLYNKRADDSKYFARRNQRPPMDVPLDAKEYKRDDIEKRIRSNLRGPNVSLLSHDTTQSRYHCLYEDCGWKGHADENAAVNIGVKFFMERVSKEDSRNKKEELNC